MTPASVVIVVLLFYAQRNQKAASVVEKNAKTYTIRSSFCFG
jgi:hypothetical protein